MIEFGDRDPNSLSFSSLNNLSFLRSTLFHEEGSQVTGLLDDGTRVSGSKLGTLPPIQFEQRGRICVDTREKVVEKP